MQKQRLPAGETLCFFVLAVGLFGDYMSSGSGMMSAATRYARTPAP